MASILLNYRDINNMWNYIAPLFPFDNYKVHE